MDGHRRALDAIVRVIAPGATGLEQAAPPSSPQDRPLQSSGGHRALQLAAAFLSPHRAAGLTGGQRQGMLLSPVDAGDCGHEPAAEAILRERAGDHATIVAVPIAGHHDRPGQERRSA